MDFKNATTLRSDLLYETFLQVVAGWPAEKLVVRVRWSRGADFSGSCFYDANSIYVNLGRHLRYPYHMETYCARSRSARGYYTKPSSLIELVDGYQVCLFVFAHEFYHWLIKQAGRNTAQKESMCDRFAARILVHEYGCALRDRHGRVVGRRSWDFQDLDVFVAAAARPRQPSRAPVLPRAARGSVARPFSNQLLLFPTR